MNETKRIAEQKRLFLGIKNSDSGWKNPGHSTARVQSTPASSSPLASQLNTNYNFLLGGNQSDNKVLILRKSQVPDT